MQFLLPVDSRIRDICGFIAIDLSNGVSRELTCEDEDPFKRKGFRGGARVGNQIVVCNSFSVRKFDLVGSRFWDLSLEISKVIRRPEWLMGHGANADLHTVYHDRHTNLLLLANSYMDCIDYLDHDGNLAQRQFLWEISEQVMGMVPERNPRAPDLCHINHFDCVDGRLIATLGNLNKSEKGAIVDLERGEFVLEGLDRPHNGVRFQTQFFVTEAVSQQLLIFDDIQTVFDLPKAKRYRIALRDGLPKQECSRFWPRGVYSNDEYIFVACSQFQDRQTLSADKMHSHIVIVDRNKLRILDRMFLSDAKELVNPVLYSILPVGQSDKKTLTASEEPFGNQRPVSPPV